jgi:hypothetical protein
MEAGYIHAVLATIQALVEFFFFEPTQLKGTEWPFRVVEFEKYWKACFPRPGIKDFKGWCNRNEFAAGDRAIFEQNEADMETRMTDQLDSGEMDLITVLSESNESNTFYAWSTLETLRSKHLWRPLPLLSHFVVSDDNEKVGQVICSNFTVGCFFSWPSVQLNLISSSHLCYRSEMTRRN